MQYAKCQKCGKEAVHLAKGMIGYFECDYEEQAGGESIYGGAEVKFPDYMAVFIRVCMECNHINEQWIE